MAQNLREDYPSHYDRLLMQQRHSEYEQTKARINWPILKEKPMAQEYSEDPDSVAARLATVATLGQPLKTGFAKFPIPKKPYDEYYTK